MDAHTLIEHTTKLQEAAQQVLSEAARVGAMAREVSTQVATAQVDPFVLGITVFVLACFVGYYVVWHVTPALHSPLMSVTNAVSSVIIVGALIAAGPALAGLSTFLGFLAVVMASVNIFGGFIVTHRMLQMFAKSR